MNSILPNMRLLGLSSTHGGRDYEELCLQIDEAREALGFELAEESIFFFYSSFPDICEVSRSVIGPIRDVSPFRLEDWVAAPVHFKTLKASTWSEIQAELQKLLSDPQFAGKKIGLKLSRQLRNGLLTLATEGIVHG